MHVKGTPASHESSATPREQALAALTRWHAERRWARLAPAALDIHDVAAVGPTQVILTSTFERRGVEYEIVHANTAPDVQDPGPDPWSVPLQHPEGLPLGSSVRSRLPGTKVHMDCGLCSRMGETQCPTCHGDGQVQHGERTSRCGTCNGRGQVRCDSCNGSGGVMGTPTVWSAIELHRELRVIEASELPLDLFLALQNTTSDSVVVHTQEDQRIDGLRRSQGYRDDAMQGTDARLHSVVSALAAAPGVDPGDRIVRQRLEVRQVPVFRLLLTRSEPIFVYGDPTRILPEDALVSVGGKVARVAPWLAALATAVAGTLWAWSR